MMRHICEIDDCLLLAQVGDLFDTDGEVWILSGVSRLAILGTLIARAILSRCSRRHIAAQHVGGTFFGLARDDFEDADVLIADWVQKFTFEAHWISILGLRLR